jgi:hypothetical protein
MMHLDSPVPIPCRAIVTAGAFETHYLRAGRGDAVVYLTTAPDDEPARAAIFRALASRFRVYAPTSASLAAILAAGGGDAPGLESWLSGFLEGLGILRASLVVDGPLGEMARAFAPLAPPAVERIVVVAAEDGAAAARGTPPALLLRAAGDPAIARTLDLLAADGRWPIGR